MRSQVTIVVTPGFDGFLPIGQAQEHVLVESLVAQPAVKSFDESVPHRLAWFDVMPRDLPG